MPRRARADSLTTEQTKEVIAFLRANGVKNTTIAKDLQVTAITVSSWANGRTTAPKSLLDYASKDGYQVT
jgi:transcriptional regulator